MVRTVNDIVAEQESNDSTNENDNDSSSSSSDGGSDDVVQLTDVQGEDGFRKTEDQLREDLKTGNTENLSQAPDSGGTDRDTSQINTVAEDLATTTKQEKQADVNLSGFEDKQGNQLTESEAKQAIASGKALQEGAGRQTSKSAKIQSRRNKAKLLEDRQEKKQSFQQRNFGNNVVTPAEIKENADLVKGAAPDPLSRKSGDLLNPNKSVGKNTNFFGELVLTGQDIIEESEDFGDQAAQKTPNVLTKSFSAGASAIGQGDNFSERAAGGIEDTIQSGIATGPGSLAGFVVGGAGAVGKAGEQEVRKLQGKRTQGPGIGGSIAGGGSKIAKEASENPVQFAVEEGSEEIGEGLFTAGLGTLAVTPSVSPKVEAKIGETKAFAKGNLGTRARESAVLQVPGQESGRVGVPRDVVTKAEEQGITVEEQGFKNLEDGGRAQDVFRVDTKGEQTQVTRGQRVETPVSRREFLKEKTGVKNKDFADFLDLSNARKGQTKGIPGIPLNKPKTDPGKSKTPDTDVGPENLFKEPKGFDPQPESISTPEATLNPKVDQTPDLVNNVINGQKQGIREDLIQEQEIKQEFKQETTTNQKTDTKSDIILEQQQRIDNTPESVFRPDPKPESTILVDGEGKDTSDKNSSSLLGGSKRFVFRESVGSQALGLEDVSRDKALKGSGNPLNLRRGIRGSKRPEDDLL